MYVYFARNLFLLGQLCPRKQIVEYWRHSPSTESISDLRQQLKRRRHGDDEDAESEKNGSSGGDSASGENDLEAAVAASLSPPADTAPGELLARVGFSK